jgi:hypothetical protein
VLRHSCSTDRADRVARYRNGCAGRRECRHIRASARTASPVAPAPGATLSGEVTVQFPRRGASRLARGRALSATALLLFMPLGHSGPRPRRRRYRPAAARRFLCACTIGPPPTPARILCAARRLREGVARGPGKVPPALHPGSARQFLGDPGATTQPPLTTASSRGTRIPQPRNGNVRPPSGRMRDRRRPLLSRRSRVRRSRRCDL